MDSQKHYPKQISCEFFPPNTDEGMAKLAAARKALMPISPAFFSVTYGAGGSTRERTLQAIQGIRANSDVDAAPHLTCVASTRAGIREILTTYRKLDIRRLVALRGDLPSGMSEFGEFRYANELVEFIRAETGDHFHIEVAAYPEFHPQARTTERDLLNFKRKVDAGANSAITQYFYNPESYFRFVDDCEKLGLDLPIVPGIMPITNFSQLARFSDNCGAEIPRWIRKRLESYGDDLSAIRAYGLDVVTDLCRRLLAAGAPGLHFYTMNRAGPTLAICERLALIRG
ncbi:5,10-methylenetetrahydrofolate reductase [Candidatus Competibacter denitrificans Run_A_D11]|uniref:Methylenetetrahydrofolate reductase n=1 Tax=Candidatus Competibacter denitrificans Run_A_D11 TaxID=1400863 RepID=W6MCF3_9GAMM|nr:methylenetetrahydrofolate reductase [NAD(P)H] [Candidatus Competibacter denitrificans]CDI01948.1 5,10-methylenetetrahydrofolate reductase [Candidatus Competibacter denitrificans Run_A_D11]HAS87553.1 methylenetetrahydrofolate reductase [NAD(P)H] [Candidatus Competibacteraceae bacterium]HRC68170.1 methylenetetrahydrofolate reductase [NAD(P)H] [Candidatus Competibacter denitrificans]